MSAASPALWSNRNYRLVFLASVFSGFAHGVSTLTLPWLATTLTRDSLLIAAVTASVRLPWLLLTLPAGVLTDRMDRHRLMAHADFLRAALSLAIMALALTAAGGGSAAIWTLCVLGFILGGAEVLRENAALTVVPSIVARADLERANGQMWSVSQITGQLLGPVLAGALIGFSVAIPFGFDAVSFALAAALAGLVSIPPRSAGPAPAFWTALGEGVRWLTGHRHMLRLALAVGVLNFFFMANFTILILYSQEVLGLSAFAYGLLMTAAALGGICGSIFAPLFLRGIGLHLTMVVALCGTVLAWAVMAGSSSAWLAVPAIFLEMFMRLLWSVVTVSYRQREAPDEILGRINSLYRFCAWGPMPLGAMAAGALVMALEAPLGREGALHAPYALGALGVGGLAVYCFFALRLR